MEKVGQPHTALFEAVENIAGGTGTALTISLLQNLDNPQHTIGRFRLSVTSAPRPVRIEQAPSAAIAAILAVAADQRNNDQQNELATYYRSISPELEPTRQQLAGIEKSRKDLESRIPSTLITASVAPRMVRVLRVVIGWMKQVKRSPRHFRQSSHPQPRQTCG